MGRTLMAEARRRYRPARLAALDLAALRPGAAERLAGAVASRWEGAAEAFFALLSSLPAPESAPGELPAPTAERRRERPPARLHAGDRRAPSAAVPAPSPAGRVPEAAAGEWLPGAGAPGPGLESPVPRFRDLAPAGAASRLLPGVEEEPAALLSHAAGLAPGAPLPPRARPSPPRAHARTEPAGPASRPAAPPFPDPEPESVGRPPSAPAAFVAEPVVPRTPTAARPGPAPRRLVWTPDPPPVLASARPGLAAEAGAAPPAAFAGAAGTTALSDSPPRRIESAGSTDVAALFADWRRREEANREWEATGF
jgi:hypothetical protein